MEPTLSDLTPTEFATCLVITAVLVGAGVWIQQVVTPEKIEQIHHLFHPTQG